MALTPEDVVNKRFQPTKFREGYDQDEVDDFLDEVVVELRRLHQENDELRQRGGEVPSTDTDAVAAPETAESTVAVGSVAVVDEPTPAPAASVSAPDVDDETATTSSLLQLARRLHEEHVREGIERRDSLIAEGHANAARIAADAEAKQQSEISALDSERELLEQRIDELRTFEREYRQKLKSYIEGQLHELDSAAASSGDEQSDDAPEGSAGSTSGRQDIAGI